MESRIHYTLVGLFVVILTFLMIYGGFWLTADRHKKTYRLYRVYMNESVGGLSERALVKFNGVPVGYVEDIALDLANAQRVKLLLSIESQTPITTATQASLNSEGITGIAYIALSASAPNAPILLRKPDEPYPVIPAGHSLFFELGKTLQSFSENANSIAKSLKEILNEENRMAFRNTVHNLHTFSLMLAQNNERFNSILSSADTLFTNTAQISKKFPEMVDDVKQAAQAMTRVMNTSHRTFQTFNQEALPPAVQTIKKIDRLSSDLSRLSEELERNPNIILRGKAPAVLGPGEK